MGLWILATLSAFYVKGLCGFANTLVFTSILSFGNSNVNISPVELILGYPTNAIIAYKERKSINIKLCLLLTSLMLVGSVPGMLMLKNADSNLIKAVFGVVTVLLGVEMLLRECWKMRIQLPRWGIGVVGVLSGLLCGLYGVGALLGAYVSRVAKDMHAFKANLCAVFFAENTLRIALYTAMGILNKQIFLSALSLSPLMLLALYTGMRSANHLNERQARRLVIVLLIVSGAALVIKTL